MRFEEKSTDDEADNRCLASGVIGDGPLIFFAIQLKRNIWFYITKLTASQIEKNERKKNVLGRRRAELWLPKSNLYKLEAFEAPVQGRVAVKAISQRKAGLTNFD